ncbi:MAG TPA: hypothetical protein VGJ94_12100 [Syntrophorhabdaceae bacterium]
MKKLVVLCVAIAIGFGLGTTCFADVDGLGEATEHRDMARAPGKKIKTTEPVKRFLGDLVSLDNEAKTIVAKNRKGEFVFDLSRTRVARNIKLEELKPGDRIGVVYIEKEGVKIAKVVGRPPARAKRSKGIEEKGGQGTPVSPQESTK